MGWLDNTLGLEKGTMGGLGRGVFGSGFDETMELGEDILTLGGVSREKAAAAAEAQQQAAAQAAEAERLTIWNADQKRIADEERRAAQEMRARDNAEIARRNAEAQAAQKAVDNRSVWDKVSNLGSGVNSSGAQTPSIWWNMANPLTTHYSDDGFDGRAADLAIGKKNGAWLSPGDYAYYKKSGY